MKPARRAQPGAATRWKRNLTIAGKVRLAEIKYAPWGKAKARRIAMRSVRPLIETNRLSRSRGQKPIFTKKDVIRSGRSTVRDYIEYAYIPKKPQPAKKSSRTPSTVARFRALAKRVRK